MTFGPTISPFFMMTKYIIWKETLSEAPPKHMHIPNVSYKQDASTIAYELILQSKLYATHLCIQRIQKYDKVCTNDSSNHPIPLTSKTCGRWMVYNGILKIKSTTYHKNKRYVSKTNKKRDT